jgi:hypothetical protein
MSVKLKYVLLGLLLLGMALLPLVDWHWSMVGTTAFLFAYLSKGLR